MSSKTANLQLIKPSRGDQRWDVSINGNMDLLDAAYGAMLTLSQDLPEVYIYTNTFNGPTGRTITLPKSVDAVNEYSVKVTPTSRGAAIGDIYVTKTTTNFVVKCSETNTTDTFSVAVYYIGDVASYGGSIYRRWYVSPDASITDHANASIVGALAWIQAQISSSPAIVELPGNKTYQIKNDLSIVSNIELVFQKGAIIKTDLSIRDSNYQWDLSGSGTNEYYLQASGGGNPNINQPAIVIEDGSHMVEGIVGSLAAGEWDWSDNDSLGYTTIYVRLSDSTDPDGKAADYVECDYTFTLNQSEALPEWFYGGTGSYAEAVWKAIDTGAGQVSFYGSTYDLTGIGGMDHTITKDVNLVSPNRAATLTATLTEKFEIPTGLDIRYEGLKFDTWWSPLDTYYTHDSVIIKDCYYNNCKRPMKAWEASVYTNSSIGRVEIIGNVVVNGENGFLITSLIGGARIIGNHLEDLESSGDTYGICVGDHDDDTGTLQANTKNIVISGNIIKQVNSTGGTNISNGITVTGTSVVISDNIIEDIDGVSTGDVEGIYTKAINLTVIGNTITDIDGTSGAITAKGLAWDEAPNPKSNKVVIAKNALMQSANTCDYGIITNGPCSVIVSSNVIEGFDDVGILMAGDTYNARIERNIIRDTGGESGIIVWGPNLDRCIISENLIEDVTGKVGDAAFGIKVRVDPGYIKDLLIENNLIRIDALNANTPDVEGIQVHPTAASERMRVLNNDLRLTHDNNDPYGINFYATVSQNRIIISGNQFHALANPLKAITFSRGYDLYTSADFLTNISNLLIFNNYADLRLVGPVPVLTQEIKRSCRIEYDFSDQSGTVGNHAVTGTSSLFPPVNAIITRAWYYVPTVLASGTSSATFGLSWPAASDYNIMDLTVITSSGTVGKHDTKITGSLANFLVGATPGDLRINVGVEEITSGVVVLFLEWVEYR